MPETIEAPLTYQAGDAFGDAIAAIKTSEAEEKAAAEKPPEPSRPPEKSKVESASTSSTADTAKESKAETAKEPAQTETKPSAVPESLFQKAEPEPELPDAPPKKAEDWKKYKDSFKSVKAELETLKKAHVPETTAKLTKYEADLKASQTEREAFKKQADDLLGVVEQIGLERSPRFVEKYVKPREEKLNAAIERVKNAGIDVDAFEEAISLPPKRRDSVLSELLGEMSDAGRAKVYALLDHVDEIDMERKSALARQPEEWRKIQEAENAANQKAMDDAAAQRKARFSEISKAMQEKYYLLRKADGADEWNTRADKFLADATHLLFEEPNFDRLAQGAIEAPLAGVYEGMWLEEREARKKAEAQLKEMGEAEPGIAKAGAATPPSKGKTLAEEWAEAQRAG